MNRSEKLDQLIPALIKLQQSLKPIPKNKINTFFKSKYADYESVWATVRTPLADNGFAVSQTTENVTGIGTCVSTTLLHISGQWIEGLLPVILVKNDPQGQGSAITYARRYALTAILAAPEEDDDGNSGSLCEHENPLPPYVGVAPPHGSHPTVASLNVDDLGSMVVPVGYNKDKKTIKELTDREIQNDIKYWSDKAKPGGPAYAYLSALKNYQAQKRELEEGNLGF